MNETAFKKQIGIKIKQLRTVKGWSRQQAADKLEISDTAYGNIERGETDICITRLAQIAEIFEIALTDLLGLTEKTVFNFKAHSQECHNWQVNSSPNEIKHELEKSHLIQQSQATEIENLKQQIVQLQQIIALMEKTNTKQSVTDR